MIRRSTFKTRAQAGQSIYQTMLAISCVMLGLAVFFPLFEYFAHYHGPMPGLASSSARTAPPPSTPAEDAAPAEGAAPAETEAPAPADAEATD